MLRSKKNKSILSSLYDRELNNNCAPYFYSTNILSLVLRSRSDSSLYTNHWRKTSSRPITYDAGYLFFSDYTTCCSIYSDISKLPPVFKIQNTKAKMKVSDVISYSLPVLRDYVHNCKCNFSTCNCLSPYILTVSEDNWLCHHLMTSGELIKQYYVNREGHKFRFKYCDWDVYGDRFILTSTLNPSHPHPFSCKKTDVVVNLAIFTTFPFEFLALLEIKRSVFGENCTAANISDQHLILGHGSTQVHIYNFEEFFKQGHLVEYKLGQTHGDGKIGHYPTGLPLNFTYAGAPPLLFNVQCFCQIVRFGGYPYHYVTAAPRNSNLFTVTNMETDVPASGGSLLSGSANADVDSLLFHPDHSNRLIFKTERSVDCYGLTNLGSVSQIHKLFSMGFPETRQQQPLRTRSSYGRSYKFLKRNEDVDGGSTIFGTDYASDLDLFAILGVSSSDHAVGFVRLYDSLTGEEVRTVQLRHELCDSNFYQLYVDMGSIIIIERKTLSINTVYVYNM